VKLRNREWRNGGRIQCGAGRSAGEAKNLEGALFPKSRAFQKESGEHARKGTGAEGFSPRKNGRRAELGVVLSAAWILQNMSGGSRRRLAGSERAGIRVTSHFGRGRIHS